MLDLLLRAADLDLLEARVTELEAAVSDSTSSKGRCNHDIRTASTKLRSFTVAVRARPVTACPSSDVV